MNKHRNSALAVGNGSNAYANTARNRGSQKIQKKTQKNSKKTEKMKKWSQRTERDFDNFVVKKKVSKSLSLRPKRVWPREKNPVKTTKKKRQGLNLAFKPKPLKTQNPKNRRKQR